MIRALISLALAAALLGGCQRQLDVTVATDGHDPATLERWHRYAISHHSATAERQAKLVAVVQREINAFAVRKGYDLKDEQPALVVGYQQPKLVQELAAVTRRVMDDHGWQNDKANAQFVVSIDAAYGRFDLLVPYRIEPNPEAQGTYVEPSDALGGRPAPVAGASPDRPGAPGHRYVHAIAVYIYPAENPQGHPWWSGSIVTVTDIEAFHLVAPQLIDELLREFPRPTGKDAERRVVIPQ